MAGWRPWSVEPQAEATITEDEWQELQRRANQANPALGDTFSAEAAARRLSAAENYKSRRMN